MKKYYVACVDLFGMSPPVEECDEVRAESGEAAAREIVRRLVQECDDTPSPQIMAVARMGRPVKWEHFEVTITVTYSAKPLDVAAASAAAAA